MKVDKLKNINRLSESSITGYLRTKETLNNSYSLKFITLSIGYVYHQDLNWAMDYAIRSLTNFLDRFITKTSIRHSISVQSTKYPLNYFSRERLWSLHGKQIKDVITGGIYKIEFAYNPSKPDMYNLHLHVLCESDYLPQPIISFIWKDVLSKPFQGKIIPSKGIVDIRNVQNTDKDIQDTFRYMVKPIPVVRNERYKYSRLLSKFGTWYGS